MNTVEETLHDVTQKEYEVQNGDMESSNKTALDGILDNLPPILVGVAGGSASGKTTLCNKIIQSLGLKNCVIVSFDSFYKTPPPGTVIADYNFDSPDALDFELCHSVIKDLLVRKPTKIPEYCFKTHRRLDKWIKVKPNDLILLEGILAFHDPVTLSIVQLMNLRIFVACDDDIRLYRRVSRDVSERGREVMGVIYQYNRFVKPAFDNFIKPSAKVANIIVPGSHDNSVAINFICSNLRAEISKFEDLREKVKSNIYHTDILDSRWLNIPENLETENLETADRIIYLRDPSAKTECVKLFNLFSEKFSKTLYQLVVIRLCTYAIKMMKRFNKDFKSEQFDIRHIANPDQEYLQDDDSDDEEIEPAKIQTNEVFALIVPFLHEDNIKSVEDAIIKGNEKTKRIATYVVTIFSEVESMTKLSKQFKNIYIVNILCVVKMNSLIEALTNNCKVKYDFTGNEELVNQIMYMSNKEIRRKEKIIELNS